MIKLEIDRLHKAAAMYVISAAVRQHAKLWAEEANHAVNHLCMPIAGAALHVQLRALKAFLLHEQRDNTNTPVINLAQ